MLTSSDDEFWDMYNKLESQEKFNVLMMMLDLKNKNVSDKKVLEEAEVERENMGNDE